MVVPLPLQHLRAQPQLQRFWGLPAALLRHRAALERWSLPLLLLLLLQMAPGCHKLLHQASCSRLQRHCSSLLGAQYQQVPSCHPTNAIPSSLHEWSAQCW
jgi:hypothetical protein